MRCLICGNELKGCLCSQCGFDLSLCGEQYPTLDAIGQDWEPLSAVRGRMYRELLELRDRVARLEQAPGREEAPAQPGPEADPRAKIENMSVGELVEDLFGPLALSFRALRRDQTLVAGPGYTAGIRPSGRVITAGKVPFSVPEIGTWTGMVSLAAGAGHLVGLRKDGTVAAAGQNDQGQCDLRDWSKIVAIAAGDRLTLGLREDGRVLLAGGSRACREEVEKWEEITAIAVGGNRAVALGKNGCVFSCETDSRSRCDLSAWRDIRGIAAGSSHVVGLKGPGLLTAGSNQFGQCETRGWTDLIACAASGTVTLGLRRSGMILMAGALIGVPASATRRELLRWPRVIAVAASPSHIVGLRENGTVVSTGSNEHNQCAVSYWKLMLPGASSR